MKYTKEQKKKYYANLRKKWRETKKLIESGKFSAILKQAPKGISRISFVLTYTEMQINGFDGIPYIDCKTYKLWKENGFMVKKGEKSKIKGITWINVNKTEKGKEEKDKYLMPKIYNLFHKSQVKKL